MCTTSNRSKMKHASKRLYLKGISALKRKYSCYNSLQKLRFTAISLLVWQAWGLIAFPTPMRAWIPLIPLPNFPFTVAYLFDVWCSPRRTHPYTLRVIFTLYSRTFGQDSFWFSIIKSYTSFYENNNKLQQINI